MEEDLAHSFHQIPKGISYPNRLSGKNMGFEIRRKILLVFSGYVIGWEGGLTAAHWSAKLVELTRLICLSHAGYSYFI